MERAQINQQLYLLYRELHKLVLSDLSVSGLSGPQLMILLELMQNDGKTVKELSTAIGLSHSTVSGVIHRLEHLEMVERRVHPQDRRSVRIFLGPQASAVSRHLKERLFAPAVSFILALPAQKKKQVIESITLLLQSFKPEKLDRSF